MIRRPPRSTLDRSSAASDVYKRQEQTDRVVKTVQPIENKIFGDQEGKPVYPGGRNFGNSLVPEKEQDNHIKRPKNQVQTTVQQHEQEIVDRIFYGIAFPLMQVTQNDLQANNDDINW